MELALRASEQKARYDERRFRDFADSTADSYWERDSDGKFTYHSPVGIVDPESIIGKTFNEVFFHSSDEYINNKKSCDELDRSFYEHIPIRNIEFSFLLEDKRREIVSINVVPVLDDYGMFQGQRGTATTITSKIREMELASAKSAADAASLAKSEFLSNMSHEIRTPMNAILGLTHLLGRTALSTEQSDFVGKISVSGRALMGILNDILDFSKIEAGHMSLEAIDFRLWDVIDTLATIMSATVKVKSLETVIGIDDTIPLTLHGDPNRLQQVLVNLACNAIKFTQEGEVVVYASLEKRVDDKMFVRFSVRDTGIGISEKGRTHLFEPFTQADSSTTRRFGGTGLGLVICKRLVDLMGGTIGVNSQLGVGSEFWFSIPFQIAQNEDNKPDSGQRMVDLKVLIVDDNETARCYLSTTAEALGMQPDIVESGEKAVSRLHGQRTTGVRYDLLLVDWQMPNMNGLEAIRKIYTDVVLIGYIPPTIIMVTAFSREDLVNSPDSGLVDYILTKPVTPSTLYNAVLEIQTKRNNTPDAQAREAKRDRRSRQISLSRLKNIRILVVEDNHINQDVARRLLEDEGAIVEISDNGAQAVERLGLKDGAAIDLVLMDAQMPVMDGFTATTYIRNTLFLIDLPIIALTAGVRTEDQQKCLDCGMNGFIGKPFDIPKFLNIILHLLGRDIDIVTDKLALARTNETIETAMAACGISIPGLDLRQALLHSGQDANLLRTMLKQTANHFAGVADRLRADLASGRTEQPIREMHTLRGTAANLAAFTLADIASRIENELRDGKSTETVAPIVDELEIALESFSNAVNTLPISNNDTCAYPAQIQEDVANHTMGIDELCHRLAELLCQYDTDAVELLNSEASMLRRSLGPHFDLLQNAISSFDFDAALDILRQSAKAVGLELICNLEK